MPKFFCTDFVPQTYFLFTTSCRHYLAERGYIKRNPARNTAEQCSVL
jgi:hypothetical protein